MMMAISAVPKLAKTDMPAAPGPSADGTSFAAMLGGVAPAAVSPDGAAAAAPAPAGKAVRAKADAVDPSLAGLSALMAAPLPAPLPAQAAPVAAVPADAGQGAPLPAQAAPLASAPAAAAAPQPAPLSPDEMAALAPALQLLAEHAATATPDHTAGQPVAATPVPLASAAAIAAAPQVATSPLPQGMVDPRADDGARPQVATGPADPSTTTPDTAAILSARAGVQPATRPTPHAPAPAAKAQDAGAAATAVAAAAATPVDAVPVPDAKAATPAPVTPDAAPARAAQTVAAQAQSAPAEARAERPASRKSDKTAAAAATMDGAASAGAVPASAMTTAAPVATPTHSATIDTAGVQLAQGGADRALDLAKGNAWLDGLSRDIAATGDAKGTLNFQVAPQQLGLVSVALKQGDDGASVSITAASEKARDLIADARPQLIAEAQANGLRIASAQVDVSTQQQGGDQGRNGQQQAGHQPHQQGSQQQAQAGNGGAFSAQSGMGGQDGQSSQTRYQPVSDTPLANPFRGGAPADSADDASPADGLYA